ncbi:hypothetical protein BGZ95_008513 [Linnemannia exigua]|uniref:F-box domain-containing protein n=1 Tax=Linnemannia exigua TaxID=604196 RepID=A0AAD4DE64_9FUNG|nr:hypothetical protein BGZ95_008513 [Linnemannia exigua]
MLRQSVMVKNRQLASNQPSALQGGPTGSRRVNKRHLSGSTNNDIVTTESKRGKSTLPVVSVEPKDPCVALPIEIWHYILSKLPLSAIAKIAVVSKTWLDGTSPHPFWRKACNKGALGEPDFYTYSDHALAFGERPSSASLSVCNQATTVSPTMYYKLNHHDLAGVARVGEGDRYLNLEVERIALVVHGGWVGIVVALEGLVNKRWILFEKRDRYFRLHRQAKEKAIAGAA